MATSMQQLELNFKVALEEVADVPERADVLALWTEFERDLSELPQREQLRVAGSGRGSIQGHTFRCDQFIQTRGRLQQALPSLKLNACRHLLL